MGAAPFAHALQRTFPRWLQSRAGVAPLVGIGTGSVSLSGLERALLAYHFRRGRHFPPGAKAHDGGWHSIHGAAGSDDAGTAWRRMAHPALWLARGHPARTDALHTVEPPHDVFPMAGG